MLYVFFLIGSFVFLTGSALLALRWAIRQGEFRNPAKASLLIFDEEEPLGQMTDFFPGKRPPRQEQTQLTPKP